MELKEFSGKIFCPCKFGPAQCFFILKGSFSLPISGFRLWVFASVKHPEIILIVKGTIWIELNWNELNLNELFYQTDVSIFQKSLRK